MHFFRILEGIPSGPTDEVDFNLAAAFMIRWSSSTSRSRTLPQGGTFSVAAATSCGERDSLMNILENFSANS